MIFSGDVWDRHRHRHPVHKGDDASDEYNRQNRIARLPSPRVSHRTCPPLPCPNPSDGPMHRQRPIVAWIGRGCEPIPVVIVKSQKRLEAFGKRFQPLDDTAPASQPVMSASGYTGVSKSKNPSLYSLGLYYHSERDYRSKARQLGNFITSANIAWHVRTLTAREHLDTMTVAFLKPLHGMRIRRRFEQSRTRCETLTSTSCRAAGGIG